MQIKLSLLIFISSFQFSLAQNDSLKHDSTNIFIFGPDNHFYKKRLALVISGEAIATTGTMIALNQVWYKDYPRTSFHFFDDSREWLQMDKAGHVVTSYYIGKAGIGMLKWCGVKEKKAAIFGGALGLVYQTGLEILDGYSSGWGFSWSDMLANGYGAFLCTTQELFWKEQRIPVKVSYHATSYPNYRPELLGSNPTQRMFKDYNGQTYWRSYNIASFIKKENKIPKWLDFTFGYSAEGMTGGSSNPVYNNAGILLPTFVRYRKYFFSLDADLWRIKTRSKILKTVLSAVGFIKIPFPTLEVSKNGVSVHPLYF